MWGEINWGKGGEMLMIKMKTFAYPLFQLSMQRALPTQQALLLLPIIFKNYYCEKSTYFNKTIFTMVTS